VSAPASVLLTRAPEPLVRRALTPSRTASWLLPGRWCVVVRETPDGPERYGETVGCRTLPRSVRARQGRGGGPPR
jgi:hypothetical protein